MGRTTRMMPTAAVHVNSAQTRQPKIHSSLLALARSGIGYEIFNETVDRINNAK